MQHRSQRVFRQNQRGAVLFVALIFLVLLTLLGLTASGTSILQERMTGGLHNGQLAMMGAETALRGVEWDIWNKSNQTPNKLHCGGQGLDDPCYQASNVGQSSGYAIINPGVTQFRNSVSNPGTLGKAYQTKTLTSMSGAESTASLSSQPKYIIEDLGVVLPPGAPTNGMGGRRDALQNFYSGNQTLHSYRNTARSLGGDTGSTRAVESYFIALPPSM
ncbi:MAG TPA: PilX N-terminal domain-containing pilus assembly protein [Rudaea sp.]|nr:PilX N-terminal domain-containing pilus assembly protein [Rudaea sp.]